MASLEELCDNSTTLKKQLCLARTEIKNLRKEIKNLKYSSFKEISGIRASLEAWRCPTCSADTRLNEDGGLSMSNNTSDFQQQTIKMQPIGFITTGFATKRAIPRQPNVNLSSHGKITLYKHIFTNPEHSLEGLDEFSHMWVLFYFNNNQSSHVRAKVAPPRLNGTRIGVFGTRSPHRPCPIGLSLVQIDKVEGCSVYFSGVDMMDGTPVLDLKPYIPHYDNPAELYMDYPDPSEMERLELDGQESDSEIANPPPPVVMPQFASSELVVSIEREAPDGEEEQLEGATLHTSSILRSYSPLPAHRHVRVPDWISQSSEVELQVVFTPQAESLVSSLQTNEDMKQIITDILREDPRSVYLRDRYTNQFYTFLINNFHVSCKFDDNNHAVKVFRVIAAEAECDCGEPEWQCSIHGGSSELDHLA